MKFPFISCALILAIVVSGVYILKTNQVINDYQEAKEQRDDVWQKRIDNLESEDDKLIIRWLSSKVRKDRFCTESDKNEMLIKNILFNNDIALNYHRLEMIERNCTDYVFTQLGFENASTSNKDELIKLIKSLN